MTEFFVSITMFWGFIFSIISIFCITNKKIAKKTLKRTSKKIFLISLGVSLIILLSVFVKFMPSIVEMFALAIVSSCWLLDLLNRERVKLDPEYNYTKFYIHDIIWTITMIIMFCWYCGYIFTSDFTPVLTVIKFIILLGTMVLSAFGSQKMLDKTL